MWVAAAVVATVVVGALVLSSLLPPPVEDVTARSSIIIVQNESFHAANVSITRCTSGMWGSATPFQYFALEGVTFKMRNEGCFSPGGGGVNGEATRPGGPTWTFSLGDRALPNDGEYQTWISSDQEVGVRRGNLTTLLVRA